MILVFLCQLLYVFLLGLQSRNVNEGQYLAAATTSFALGITGLTVTASVVKAALINPDPLTLAAYILAGPVGICGAMWAHGRVCKK